MFAMANGVLSRPVVNKFRIVIDLYVQLFKRLEKVAELLNVRITLEDGKVSAIEWINVCDSLACSSNVCVTTDDLWYGTQYEEDVSSH